MKATVERIAIAVSLGLVLLDASSSFAITPPQKVIAVLDSTQNFGTTKRSVNFYDVTNLSGTVFNQQPLFSVWTGYEMSGSANFEDPDTITVNPVNGTVYMEAFDSGPAGVADPVGDTQGDYDLYRIDYQKILNDFNTNGRARGTMYAPTIGPDGVANVDHPDHPGGTVFISNAITKVGELARPQDGPFYDTKLQFVNPATLMFLDNQTGPDGSGDTVANDHQIRFWTRTSTSPGAATYNSPTQEGGFNGNTAQSWQAKIGALVDMDDGTGRSEPVTMAYVKRDGVAGVWVGESDGGGDDVSFFELNFNTLTATKKEMHSGPSPYPTGFALDNDPVANPASNDGVLDWIAVDKNGHLKIGESGNFDTPQTQPKVIGREVTNYNAPDSDSNGKNEITFGAWSVSGHLAPTLTDDPNVIDGRFVAYDKGTGLVYFFDPDSGALPNVVGDVYVFDPSTGTIVYQELNAANHFFERHGLEIIMRGDTTGDGLVTAGDIDKLFQAILDPTLSGTVASALGKEWFDLTGDGQLTLADADELVKKILHTAYGDTNLDGHVDAADFATLQAHLGLAGGWADGDLNGDGVVSFADFARLQQNFGFSAPGGGVGVPEPSTVVLLGVGLVGLAVLRRKTR